jgi:hypothetical protein
MLNMVFAIQGCDIRATERATTIVAKESQPAEVVLFTKRKLAAAILGVDWEELGRDYFTTILHCVRPSLPESCLNCFNHTP